MTDSLYEVKDEAERCIEARDTEGLQSNLRLLGSMHQLDDAREIAELAQQRGLQVELELPKELRRRAA